MSPAVTRATAATAFTTTTLATPPSSIEARAPSPLTSTSSQDRRSSTPSLAREPFVPKRKPTKAVPYTYLVTEASASAESLPNRSNTPVVVTDQIRPASALDTPITTAFSSQSPKPIRQQSNLAPQSLQQHRAGRTTRSTSRNLSHLSIAETHISSAPVSAVNTPLLRSKQTFAPTNGPQPQLRPRSHTPTTMTTAVRSTAASVAPVTPKIKAAVSADVAARIRSPRKHASTTVLRSTASTAAVTTSSSRSAHPFQQSSQTQQAKEAYTHSSSTWQSQIILEADSAGDTSFVYDAQDTNLGNETSETVQVYVRLRPAKPREECAWIANPYSSTISLEPSISTTRAQSASLGPFAFDGIQTGSANRPVYISVARPLVRAALDGYDAVVFAYGQTASGKTFTLSGDDAGTEAGIIPRAVRDIFRGIQQSSARREYLLRASYLEIWNENVKDLLEPSNVPQVRDDKRKRGGKGTTVQPLREEIVTSPAQVKDLLARGQGNRHVGATDWNERSSRSHTCFKITIESWDRDTTTHTTSMGKLGKKVTVSELCLIDLAGSEKYVSQGSDRRAEGAHINKSLLTLGKVIYALSEKSSSTNPTASAAGGVGVHIPYRDSKLTRILQNSLSGNARVAVVCTINPNPSAVDESLSTLNFAKRIKKVGLNARRNEIDGSAGGIGAEAQALILRYQTEAEVLRKMVADLQKQGTRVVEEEVEDERIRELQERTSNGSTAFTTTSTSTSDSTPTTSRSTSHSSAYARPVSPIKRTPLLHLYSNQDDSNPHVLAEKLFHANKKVASLTAELSSRPSLPASSAAQADLIATLRRQISELEAVCEAQATDAPPKIREDVEREWKGKVEELEQRIKDKDEFIRQIQGENEKLHKVNGKLMQLAHDTTKEMVENLSSPIRSGKAISALKNSDRSNTLGTTSGGSPFKPDGGFRQRPMSLYNPIFGSSSGSANAFPDFSKVSFSEQENDNNINKNHILESIASKEKINRRSISNDYTLLRMGTHEIEQEILLKSSTISSSDTFAILPKS
uniref:Related to Kinesin n=1 Tax=Melanopsichium pennsylvanicum 4 TaxID=1398559 RepID=A0A077R7C1_9BASI|nr:related to Kinesin [Melanopsichium pennsylvanicum 4]